MILVITGHIRQSFKTKSLYDLIKSLYNIDTDLKIFIHTWNVFSNNISWRKINSDNKTVNDTIIYDYFGDLKHLIKHIIIDDDTKINLIGNLHGKIGISRTPIIGWKNYWYSKYKIIDYIYSTNIYRNEMIINTRFDVNNNSNSVNNDIIIKFINNNSNIMYTKNIFLFNDENHLGIDNIYIGNIYTMYILINKFFYDLDDIIIKNKNTRNPEKLVYRLNNELFNYLTKNKFKKISLKK
jgi:hypothetical protein